MSFTPWGAVAFTGGLSVTGGINADTVAISSAQANGNLLTITNSTAAPANPNVVITSAASTDSWMGEQVTGDNHARLLFRADGRLAWGPGNAAQDTFANRGAVGVWNLNSTSGDVATAGQGLRVAEGSNAKQGTATLVAGTVVVANTSVTATSRILLTTQTPGGTAGFLVVSARTAGTSFTILSSSGTDTSVVAYQIFEPG